MPSIYIYNYNNYYNRLSKREGSLNLYGESIHTQSGINFNPNDGVNTQLVVGKAGNEYHGSGDYLIYSDDGVNITSRWFIIESVRIRQGQYNVTLRRDVIADNYQEIIDAPIYIEKATVGDNDPAIYNRENIGFNEILKTVTTLKDKSNCAWLVGYAPRHTVINVELDYTADLVPDYEASSISQLPFYNLLNKEYKNYSDVGLDIYFKMGSDSTSYNSFNRYGDIAVPAWVGSQDNPHPTAPTGYGWVTQSSSYNNGYTELCRAMYNKTPLYADIIQIGTTGGIVPLPIHRQSADKYASYIRQAIPASSWTTIKDQVNAYTGNTEVSELDQYVNKICKIGDTYYTVEMQTTTSSDDAWSAPIEGYKIPAIETIVRSAYNASAQNYMEATKDTGYNSPILRPVPIGTGSYSASDFCCSIRTSGNATAKLVLKKYTGQTSFKAKLVTDESNLTLTDAPYDMFCMPYSDTLSIKTKEGTYTARQDVAMAVMNAIANKYAGSNTVLDIQLLPYCPLPEYLTTNQLDLTKASSLATGNTNYYFVKDGTGTATLGVFIYCSKSTNNFTIPYSIPITEKKIQVCCDKYRLCSPNYSDIFEFNAAMNDGVDQFNVDFTYKPFNPYIHVNPNFKALYGNNVFEGKATPRGLICGGDFSITMLTDAYETYSLQNKNFQASFQRQIQNMVTQHDIQRTQDIASTIFGGISGATSGAIAGSVGGPVGAAVGGIIGGVASFAGGSVDYSMNEQLRTEAINYTKDMFNYQIGNIKALPDTLSKLTAMVANNFIYPVIEYYTCTDTERQALRDKIKYNGMTVNRIGKISQFIQPKPSYIKGSLIRLEDITDDFHMVKAISDELYKGVFI